MLKAAMAGVSQHLAVIIALMGAVMEGLVEAFIEAVMVALMQRAPIKFSQPDQVGQPNQVRRF
jgi:hypothetical protein